MHDEGKMNITFLPEEFKQRALLGDLSIVGMFIWK